MKRAEGECCKKAAHGTQTNANCDKEGRAKSSVMPAAAAPVPAPEVVSSNKEDANLSAAFGPLFRALPKELVAKTMPAERTVTLSKVSKGARQALAAARPAAVVKAKGRGERIARLGERLGGMVSWCIITVLAHCGNITDIYHRSLTTLLFFNFYPLSTPFGHFCRISRKGIANVLIFRR